MKTFITSIILLCSTAMYAQQTANAILFSNTGQRFIVILNGARMNNNFETNVKLSNLNAEFYKIKLLFENGAPKQKEFNLYTHLGKEITYELKNVKQRYVLRFSSEVPLPPTMPTPPVGNNSIPPTTPVNVGNAPIINIPITINTGSGTINNGMPTIPPAGATTSNGGYGCPAPMNGVMFEQAKESIKSKPFEDNKLQIAKQVLNTNCMTSAQVKEIMNVFSFEDNRLDFAKFAYGKTWDYNNYYSVNDAFKFSSSIDELNAYIQSFQR
jgi:hypothetical protein